MDTVAWVADFAGEGIYTGNMHDRSGFHNLSLYPESWPLVKMPYADTDWVCTTTPFGWNESPGCYHASSEAKAAYPR